MGTFYEWMNRHLYILYSLALPFTSLQSLFPIKPSNIGWELWRFCSSFSHSREQVNYLKFYVLFLYYWTLILYECGPAHCSSSVVYVFKHVTPFFVNSSSFEDKYCTCRQI